MKPFPDRVQAFHNPGARAADGPRLIAEVDDLIAASEAAERECRAKSLDRTTADKDAIEARRTAEDHALATERLRAMRESIKERLADLKSSDQAKANERFYNEAAEQSAGLAAELADEWPALEAKLIGFFERIEADEQNVAAANKRRPGGSPALVPAEFVARGCGASYWPPSNINPVDRLTVIKLPRFKTWGHAWPIDHLAIGMAANEEASANQVAAHKASQTPEALATARAAEEAQWARYRLFHQRGHMIVDITHRHGVAGLKNGETFLWMNSAQVERARTKGIEVTRAPSSQVEEAAA